MRFETSTGDCLTALTTGQKLKGADLILRAF
jgi:hypothetical protein